VTLLGGFNEEFNMDVFHKIFQLRDLDWTHWTRKLNNFLTKYQPMLSSPCSLPEEGFCISRLHFNEFFN